MEGPVNGDDLPRRAGALREGGGMNLNSVLIGSEDPKPLVDYYTKLFGAPSGSEGGYTWWQLGTGGFTVSEHSEVKGKNAHPGRVIWNIETTDVKGDFEKLKAAGAKVVQEPYAPDTGDAPEAPEMSVATFADPDDNYFQLVSPM
jgi:predicted enzyme related to lactoylglutathione lyase